MVRPFDTMIVFLILVVSPMQVYADSPILLYYFERVPYAVADSQGEISGLCAAPAAEAFQKDGIPFQWKKMPFKRQLATIKHNKKRACGIGWFKNAERERFQRHLIIAEQLNARMMRLTAGQAHPGISREAGIEYAVEGLTWAANRARKSSVRLVYENHSKPGVWEHADFSHPADVFLEIAARLAPASTGILFDTANADARNDDGLALLEQVINRVECIHVADTAVRGQLRCVLIGEGVAPLSAILNRLKQAGYDGWFSIEENSGDSWRGIRHAIDVVRRLWE